MPLLSPAICTLRPARVCLHCVSVVLLDQMSIKAVRWPTHSKAQKLKVQWTQILIANVEQGEIYSLTVVNEPDLIMRLFHIQPVWEAFYRWHHSCSVLSSCFLIFLSLTVHMRSGRWDTSMQLQQFLITTDEWEKKKNAGKVQSVSEFCFNNDSDQWEEDQIRGRRWAGRLWSLGTWSLPHNSRLFPRTARCDLDRNRQACGRGIHQKATVSDK